MLDCVHTGVMVVVALLTLAGITQHAAGESDGLDPWSAEPDAPVIADGATEPAVASAMTASATFGRDCCAVWLAAYRGGLSSLFPASCAQYPSCSAYSRQAIEAHGAFVGMVLTVDRIFREWDDLRAGNLELIKGKWLFRDPFVPEIFWWGKQ